MKHLYSILIAVALTVMLAACSSDSGDDIREPNNSYDRYGVGRWDNPDDFVMKRYYTLVDTFTIKQPNVAVMIKVTAGVSTDVRWEIDGVGYGSTNVDEPSNSADELIIRTYYPDTPQTPHNYKDLSVVKAFVKVGKERIDREAVIDEQKFERDILNVDFGMDSLTVKGELEQAHGTTRFFMRDENTGVDLLAPHFLPLRNGNGRTLYLFDEDELAEVAEFPGSIWETTGSDGDREPEISPFFIDFCRSVGFEGELEIIDGTILAKEYEWEREGILYRIHSRDDVFPVEPASEEEGGGTRTKVNPGEDEEPEYQPYSIGISYRKL